MMDNFAFTKEDSDLIGGISIRDPLGLQILWSAMGRKLIPHLTEQTTNIEGFQLLLTIFHLYKKFQERIDRNFNDYRSQLKGRSVQQTFGLENFFFFAEQAFAFIYFSKREEWNLPGRRQVVAFAGDPRLSQKRPIMRSQLSTGVWGLYRGAAMRAQLLNDNGMSLSTEAFAQLTLNTNYDRRSWGDLFDKITTAMLEGECEISTNGNSLLVQLIVDVIDLLPERKLLRRHLLNPPNGEIVPQFSEMASIFLNKEDDLRALFHHGRQMFPSQAVDFANIIKCEDLISTLESVFEYLLHFNGKKVTTIAKELPLDLSRLAAAKNEFASITTWPKGLSQQRSCYLVESIETGSARELIESVIRAHAVIADSRGAVKWIVINDDGRLICETDPFTTEPILKVKPGEGWRYDYYVRPMVSIYRGLK